MKSNSTGEILDNAAESRPQDSKHLRESIMARGGEKDAMALLDMEADPFRTPESQQEPSRDSSAETERESNEAASEDYRNYQKRLTEREAFLIHANRKLEELWKLLMDWIPSSDQALSEDLRFLKMLYEKILFEIMENYNQKETVQLVSLLNTHILQIVRSLSELKFPRLQCFFEQFGRENVADTLKETLYRLITGRNLMPRGKPGQIKDQSAFSNAGSRPSDSGRLTEGMIYSHSGGNKIKANEAYRENLHFIEQTSGKEKHSLIDKDSFSLLKLSRGSYTAAEIAKAEQFLHYMEQSGYLWTSPSFTAMNEELTGFLMAEAAIKFQIFVESGAIGSEMGNNLLGAVNQFLSHALIERSETCLVYEGNLVEHQLVKKEVWHTYHIIMNLFLKWKKPQEALSRGLQYAFERFLSKKADEEYKNTKRYGENSGFFRKFALEKELPKDFEAAIPQLKKDWENFLTAIDQKDNRRLQLAMMYSPWGMMEEEEKTPQIPAVAHPASLLIAAAVIIAVALIFWLL